MGSRAPGLIGWLQSLRGRPMAAAVILTVLTLAVVGSVVLTTTSLGCGPAQKLGLKGVTSHCKGQSVAALTSPSAGTQPSTTPVGRTFTPVPSPSYVPYSPPASPPYQPPSSPPSPPDTGPASGAYPPFNPPATGSGGLNQPAIVLSCRLPVYVGPAGSGGFIVFPGGTYIADPTSSVTIPSPSPAPSPSPPGYGPGYTGLSYDRAYSRWLPVPYTQVAPDGRRYAHVSPDAIYVENVADGTTIELGQGHAWGLIGVENEGVYAIIVNQPGLWLLPYSGTPKEIVTSGYWQIASRDAAFGTTVSAVPQGVANAIIRVDFATGAITNWFTRADTQSYVMGLDGGGHPLISVSYFANGAGNEVWDATGPNVATPIFGSGEYLGTNGSPLADSRGIWFPMYFSVPYGQSTVGLALYIPGSGLYWMSNYGTQLAGACA